jgi:hypothetical protein
MECLDKPKKELKFAGEKDEIYRLKLRQMIVKSRNGKSHFTLDYGIIPIQILNLDFDFESYGIGHAEYLRSEILMNENHLQIIDILGLFVGKKKRAKTLIWHYLAYWEGPQKEACLAYCLNELARLYNHKNALHLTYLEEIYYPILLNKGFRCVEGSRCLVGGRIGKLRRERVEVRKV